MNKYIFSFLFVVGLVFVGGVVLAEGDVVQDELVDLPISISIAQVSDTVVEDGDMGILPTSSWYFLKEWRRGIQKLFTFSAVGKAELDVEFTDEKARELRIVEANDPEDSDGIENAITNYLDSKELLEARFTSLTKNLNDNNRVKAEAILDKWDAKSDEHRALFDELAEKHGDLPVIQEVSGAIDWATPLTQFRGNIDDFAEAARRIQDTDEFRDAVGEIEDLKADIEKGSDKSARTNCAQIEADIAASKQRLIAGKTSGPDFAREFGILQNELKACKSK